MNGWLFVRDPSEPVATGLNNHECLPQLFLTVDIQDTFQFLVYRALSRRHHAKVNDSRAQSVDEDQPTKIPIPCDEETALSLGGLEQLFVLCLRKSDLSQESNVVPKIRKQAHRRDIDVLVRVSGRTTLCLGGFNVFLP